jgi:hypothetical protein
MGVRLYAANLGRFLSTDPVAGGSANDYDYADADPIDQQDIDGRVPSWLRNAGKWAWRNKVDIALTATMFVPGLGVASMAARAYRFSRLVKPGVYVVRTLKGQRYVGQSGNMAVRLQQHVAAGKISAKAATRARVKHVPGGMLQRRIMEQRTINRLGGVRNLANLRNEIRPSRWAYYGIRRPR